MQVKNIVHVWEVGHLTSSLVSVAMTGSTLTHSPYHTVLLIMLDLSRPEELWTSFEETLSVLRNGLKMSYDSETIQKLREKRIANIKKDMERGVDPFPMQICILGGRYDEFKVFYIYVCIKVVKINFSINSSIHLAYRSEFFILKQIYFISVHFILCLIITIGIRLG